MSRTDSASPTLDAQRLELDPVQRKARCDGRDLGLSRLAFDVLHVLSSVPGRVFSAAELTAAAWPGQVVQDGSLRMQIAALRRKLGPDRLQNVAGRGYRLALPEQAVQVVQGARWQAAQPAPTAWTDDLLGREADLAEAAALLDRHRLVTVVGAGGIGKTRLAQVLAQARRAMCRDGCWWVDLASVPSAAVALDEVSAEDIAAVARVIADAMALQTPALKDAGAAVVLARALARRECLLVLDNAEHLVPAVNRVVQALLDHAPGLRLLLTSQQGLQRSDEWVYRLGTLAVPAPGATPAQVRASPAVRLLQRRAQALQPRFAIADADVPAAADLVRQLDGIALAIELAAAQLPARGFDAVQAALVAQLPPVLPAPDRSPGDVAVARHRSLQTALAWSLGLLSSAERQALSTLSVFAGVFTLPAALDLLVADQPDETRRLNLVQRLADASLLQLQLGPGAVRRLRLLDTMRRHAHGLLQGGGRLQAVRERHARVLAAVAEQAIRAFNNDTDSDAAWLDAWMPWHTDWIAAFDHAAASGDTEAAGPLSEVLTQVGYMTGRLGVIRQRGAIALALAERATGRSRAWLLNRAVQASHAGSSRLKAAQARVQAWRAAGDAPGLCQAMAFLAVCLQHAGDPQGADAAHAECDALVQPAWPPRLRLRCGPATRMEVGATRGDAAMVLREQGMVEELARAGAWRLSLMVSSDIALALRVQGEPEAAAQRLRDIIASFRQLGTDADVSMQTGILSAALVECADRPGLPAAAVRALHEQACEQAEKALLLQDPEDPSALRYFLEPLAWLACRLGQPALAATVLAAGDRMRRDFQYGCHAMNARAGQQVRDHIARVLGQGLGAAVAAGERMQGDALRLSLLRWLQSRRASEPSFDSPLLAN
jgi:predicted ATPase/DNA-binding winged helix-turn-helix (wHTH) protein